MSKKRLYQDCNIIYIFIVGLAQYSIGLSITDPNVCPYLASLKIKFYQIFQKFEILAQSKQNLV